MSKHRLNIELPSDEYTYLEKICAKKGLSIKDFVIPLILTAMKEEENILLMKKVRKRLKKMNSNDLIPIKDAFKEAGWIP